MVSVSASCRDRNSKPRHPRKIKLLRSLPLPAQQKQRLATQALFRQQMSMNYLHSFIYRHNFDFFRLGFPSAWPGLLDVAFEALCHSLGSPVISALDLTRLELDSRST